jgi:hypothetical protein
MGLNLLGSGASFARKPRLERIGTVSETLGLQIQDNGQLRLVGCEVHGWEGNNRLPFSIGVCV